jgi:hypothetical protein
MAGLDSNPLEFAILDVLRVAKGPGSDLKWNEWHAGYISLLAAAFDDPHSRWKRPI